MHFSKNCNVAILLYYCWCDDTDDDQKFVGGSTPSTLTPPPSPPNRAAANFTIRLPSDPLWDRFRYLVAVTADLDKVSRMLDRLLPLVSPRDSVVLLHIMDESVEDVIAGETEDEEQVCRGGKNDLCCGSTQT